MTNSPSLNRILNDARVRLPGAIDSALISEIYNTLDDFFRHSLRWRCIIPLLVDPSSQCYTVTPSVGKPALLIWVSPDKDITAQDGTYPPSAIQPAVVFVNARMPIPGQIELAYAPNMEQTYYVCMALTVRDPVAQSGFPVVPDWILDHYRQGITDGLIGNMMTQSAKPYTNIQAAAYHLGRFRVSKNQAKNDAQHQSTFRAQNWTFPQSFNVRRK